MELPWTDPRRGRCVYRRQRCAVQSGERGKVEPESFKRILLISTGRVQIALFDRGCDRRHSAMCPVTCTRLLGPSQYAVVPFDVDVRHTDRTDLFAVNLQRIV